MNIYYIYLIKYVVCRKHMDTCCVMEILDMYSVPQAVVIIQYCSCFVAQITPPLTVGSSFSLAPVPFAMASSFFLSTSFLSEVLQAHILFFLLQLWDQPLPSRALLHAKASRAPHPSHAPLPCVRARTPQPHIVVGGVFPLCSGGEVLHEGACLPCEKCPRALALPS